METLIRYLWRLIWAYAVCKGLSVPIFWVIMVIHYLHFKCVLTGLKLMFYIYLKLNFPNARLNMEFMKNMPLMKVFQENNHSFSKRFLPAAVSECEFQWIPVCLKILLYKSSTFLDCSDSLCLLSAWFKIFCENKV